MTGLYQTAAVVIAQCEFQVNIIAGYNQAGLQQTD
jgi:hypothetical protein